MRGRDKDNSLYRSEKALQVDTNKDTETFSRSLSRLALRVFNSSAAIYSGETRVKWISLTAI
jgi:hypothetical protein